MQDEWEKFESELRRIPPMAPPPQLMERLRITRREPDPQPAQFPKVQWTDWFSSWRSVALTAPASVVILILWLLLSPAAGPGKAEASGSAGIKANAVQVSLSLLGTFDTMAKLPDGEPVRLRCKVWQDGMMLRDDAHGVVISQSAPRIEVVPVSIETE
jgi:hypothetical protein